MGNNKKTWISTLLAFLFGPFGMFYWGLRIGLASFVGMAIFILITTVLGYGIGIKYQILIRIVFIVINFKYLNMESYEIENLKKMNTKEFTYLAGMILLNFAFFGFIGYVLLSILGKV